MTQTAKAPPTRREIIKQELATLAFITRSGNWLFLLLSRLAEPLMFLSVLYVIAETVLPGLFKAHMLLGISSACIIVLNTAPEVILPGCFMQASMAKEDQAWMYKAMGSVFIGLTFITLASFIWSFPAGAVSVILFFRCAAGVLYSLLVRMTPQRIDVMSTRQHQDQLDELTTSFNQQLQKVDVQFQRRLTEAVSTLRGDFQSSTEGLSTLPELKKQLTQFERTAQQQLASMAEEVSQVRATVEQQSVAPAKRSEHPSLYALPAATQKQPAQPKEVRQASSEAKGDEKFDIGAFVHRCLEENAESTIETIQQRALSIGQTISTGSISRYRKMYFEARQAV